MKGKSSFHFDFQCDILNGHGKAGNENYVTPFNLVHKEVQFLSDIPDFNPQYFYGYLSDWNKSKRSYNPNIYIYVFFLNI